MSKQQGRKYELVCYGVTGFTGQLVAQYLHSVDAIRGKWALAGRNKDKIASRMKEVNVEGVDIIIADSNDESSLDDMCKQARVVISLVGPYARYGEPLVAAAVRNGTHYVDLTGEAHWCAKMIKKYGEEAIKNRSVIVFSCGFDSVPSDLTVMLAVQKLKALGSNVHVGQVKGAVKAEGGMSGGTFASALDLAGAPAQDKKVAANPYALSPITGKDKGTPYLFTSSTFGGKRTWGSFWIMGPHNTAIVRRTWGIFESADASSKVFAYGPDFVYDEYMAVANPVVASVISFVLLFSFGLLTLVPPIRWLAAKYGPQPGTGPSQQVQENGYFKLAVAARSTDGKKAAQVTMRGKGDPGYAATSKMIAECALSLVLDGDRLPPLAKQGGFLTPASAFGPVLVERLEQSGFFSFSSEIEEDGKTK